MVKTFTPLHAENPAEEATDEQSAEPFQSGDEAFYNNIRPKLNELIRNPSDKTILAILNYARLM